MFEVFFLRKVQIKMTYRNTNILYYIYKNVSQIDTIIADARQHIADAEKFIDKVLNKTVEDFLINSVMFLHESQKFMDKVMFKMIPTFISETESFIEEANQLISKTVKYVKDGSKFMKQIMAIDNETQ